MSETESTLMPIRELSSPYDAGNYLWAPKGDFAIAHSTHSIRAALGEAVRDRRDTFRWALPPNWRVEDYDAPAVQMAMRVVAFRVEAFRHGERYGTGYGARFASSEDARLFMEELPHLALSATPK